MQESRYNQKKKVDGKKGNYYLINNSKFVLNACLYDGSSERGNKSVRKHLKKLSAGSSEFIGKFQYRKSQPVIFSL